MKPPEERSTPVPPADSHAATRSPTRPHPEFPDGTSLGRLLFAAGLCGIGILDLRFGDFALNWQPVPNWVPYRGLLAYASGAVLVAAGAGSLIRRTAARSALALAVFVSLCLLLLQVPRVAVQPLNEGVWLGFGENMLLVAGGWILFSELAAFDDATRGPLAPRSGFIRTARILFAIVLPVIGLSHFVYLDATTSMVPHWLHWRRGFAVLTGCGHVAAGIGMLSGAAPRLAATLEALMISCFVLLLHVPGVVAAAGNRLQWTMLCIATSYAGAAWLVALSFRTVPKMWGD